MSDDERLVEAIDRLLAVIERLRAEGQRPLDRALFSRRTQQAIHQSTAAVYRRTMSAGQVGARMAADEGRPRPYSARTVVRWTKDWDALKKA